MSQPPSRSSDPVRRFLDKYLSALHKAGVEQPFDGCHVKQAEAFIKGSAKGLVEPA